MNSSSHCLFSTMNSSAMLLIKSSFKAVKERKEDFLKNGWEKLRCHWKMEVRLDVALCQYSLKPEYNFIIHLYPKQRTCCLHFFLLDTSSTETMRTDNASECRPSFTALSFLWHSNICAPAPDISCSKGLLFLQKFQ